MQDRSTGAKPGSSPDRSWDLTSSRECARCPVKGHYNPKDGSCSVPDPSDNMPVTCVGAWSEEKHERLTKYVDISRAARRKFMNRAGAPLIDLYSGPGRCRIKYTTRLIDGSALAAYRSSKTTNTAFSKVIVADLNSEYVDACVSRIQNAGGNVRGFVGPASSTVHQVCDTLRPGALNVTFLDPYSLGALPFTIIERLCAEKRMDFIIHVSTQDLQRNMGRYLTEQDGLLDGFAPGWRAAVDDTRQTKTEMRRAVINHWISLIRSQSMETADGIEQVTGTRNQNLYWLVFATRSGLAKHFWESIRNIGGQRQLI